MGAAVATAQTKIISQVKLIDLASHNVWLNLYEENRNNDVAVGVGTSPFVTQPDIATKGDVFVA